MIYYNPLPERLQRLGNRSISFDVKEQASSQVEEAFVGSFEEENLHRIQDKIQDGWITAKLPPYANRKLGKEGVGFLKSYFTKPFPIKKSFTKKDRERMWDRLNSIHSRRAAEENKTLDKLEAFLKLPMWSDPNDIILSGEINLSKSLTKFLNIGNHKKIHCRGGVARGLALPWTITSLKERLDPLIDASPERKATLSPERPDIDLIVIPNNAGRVLDNNQSVFEDIARAIWGTIDPDLMGYYVLIVEKVICKSDEVNNGQCENSNISFGDGGKHKVDLTQQHPLAETQFFELHGLEIEIPTTTLSRWAKNPNEGQVTRQDEEEVLVNTDRVKEDDGAQASLDLICGLLHAKMPLTREKKAFARYMYWLSHHCLGYEGHLRPLFLNALVEYQERDMSRKIGNLDKVIPHISKVIADSILSCDTDHNMGNRVALRAMLVNTLIALQDEMGIFADKISSHFLEHFPHVGQDSLDVFAMILSKEKSLPALRLFAFLKAASVKDTGQVKAYLTNHGKQLQVVDGCTCVTKFSVNQVIDSIDELPLEQYEDLYSRLFADAIFDPTQPNQLNRLTNIDWLAIERKGLQLLQNEYPFRQKFGYLLLLACNASHSSFALHRTLIKHFSGIVNMCFGTERECLTQNFERAMQKSAYGDSFNGIDLTDLARIDEQLIVAISPWDISLATSHWEQMSGPESIELGKRLIEKWITTSPKSALRIFSKIREFYLSEEAVSIYCKLLKSCRDLEHTTLLQENLLAILRTSESVAPVEKRKGNHRKKDTHQTDSSLLMKHRKEISRLVMTSLQICPDGRALELFALAIARKLIDEDKISYDCLAQVSKHRQGGKAAVLTLWRQFQEHQLKIHSASDTSVATSLCEDFFDNETEESIALVNELLPEIWVSGNEKALDLLKRRLETHVAKENTDEIEHLLTHYGHLLDVAHYRRFLFNTYLKKEDYENACAQLIHLQALGSGKPELDALLRTFSDVKKCMRPVLETLIELALPERESFSAEQLIILFNLICQLLDNDQPLSKSIKDKIREIGPDLINLAVKYKLGMPIYHFFKSLVHRQLNIECDSKIVINICQLTLKNGNSREQIELVLQFLTFFKLNMLTDLPQHILLFRTLVQDMIKCRISDMKWNNQLFAKIMNMIEFQSKTEKEALTPDLLYEYVIYFGESPHCDAEDLLKAAANSPALVTHELFDQAYAYLALRTTHLARSLRLLLEKEKACRKFNDPSSTSYMIQETVRVATPEILKKAIACFFQYHVMVEREIAEQLFRAVSMQENDSLLDYLWNTFNAYCRTSFEWHFIRFCLENCVSIICERQSACLEDVFQRLPEIYELTLKFQVNPEEQDHFHQFKDYLVQNYPEFVGDISRLNYTYFIEMLQGREKGWIDYGDRQFDVMAAYDVFKRTKGNPELFQFTNKLFTKIMLSYAERAFKPKNPAVIKMLPDQLLLIRVKCIQQLSEFRFNSRFQILTQASLKSIDETVLGFMLDCLMLEQVEVYLEQFKQENQGSSQAVQEMLVYIAKRIPKELSIQVIKLLCTYAAKDLKIDALALIRALEKDIAKESFQDVYDLLKTHLILADCPGVLQCNVETIRDILTRKILISDADELAKSVLNLLTNLNFRSWIDDSGFASLWCSYLIRRLFLINQESLLMHQEIEPIIRSTFETSEIIIKSKEGLENLFKKIFECLMNEITANAKRTEEGKCERYLQAALRQYLLQIEVFLQGFCSYQMIELAKANKEENDCIHNITNENNHLRVDLTLRECTDVLLELSKTQSHDEVRKNIRLHFQIFNVPRVLRFQSENDRIRYFGMATTLIQMLCVHEVAFEAQRRCMMISVKNHMELLIDNFPDRVDDILKLFTDVCFAYDDRELLFTQTIKRYLLLKLMVTIPVLKICPDNIYQLLVYLYAKPFQFPQCTANLKQYQMIIFSLLNKGHLRLVNRAIEMVNEIPPEFVTSVDDIENFGEILACLLTTITKNINVMFLQQIRPHSNSIGPSLNEVFLQCLITNRSFHKKNPNWTQAHSDKAACLASTYLNFLCTCKDNFPNINFSTYQLFDTFKLLLNTEYFIGKEDLFLDELLLLYKEVFKVLASGVNLGNVAYLLIPDLMIDHSWGAHTHKAAKIIIDYFIDLHKYTFTGPTIELLSERFMTCAEQFKLSERFPKDYQKILNRLCKFPNKLLAIRT